MVSRKVFEHFSKFSFCWTLKFVSPFLLFLVEHNTFIPSEVQSCKFKYSFLTKVPRKVFEGFSKFCFLVSKFFCPLWLTGTCQKILWSITLWHRLSYIAENLNTASLLGSLGSFLRVFRNFAFLVSKFFSILPCDVLSHWTAFSPCGLPGRGGSRVE